MQKGQQKLRRVCTLRRGASGKTIGSKTYEWKDDFYLKDRNFHRIQKQPQMHVSHEDLEEDLSPINFPFVYDDLCHEICGAGFDDNNNLILNFYLGKTLSSDEQILAEDYEEYKAYCLT